MGAFSASGALVFFTSLFVGFLIFLFRKKDSSNFYWLLFSLAMSIWGLGAWVIGSIPLGKAKLALLWWNIANVGVILLPLFFLCFVHAWLKIRKRWLIVFSSIYAILFLGLDFMEMIAGPQGYFSLVPKVVWRFHSFYYNTASYSDLCFIYFLTWSFIFTYAAYEIWKYYQKTSGEEKVRIKYFIIGLVISLFGGIGNWLPIFIHNNYTYPYLNFLTPVYLIVLALSLL